MGRGDADGARKRGSDAGSPQPKKSLFKRLFTKGIRSRSAGRIVADAEGSPSHSSAATASVPATPHGAPAAFVTPPSSPTAAEVATSGPARSDAAPAAGNAAAAASPAGAASGSGPRSLMVQVIAARRLRAADSNGLSDPYCLVKVGARLGRLASLAHRVDLVRLLVACCGGPHTWNLVVWLCCMCFMLLSLIHRFICSLCPAGGWQPGKHQD